MEFEYFWIILLSNVEGEEADRGVVQHPRGYSHSAPQSEVNGERGLRHHKSAGQFDRRFVSIQVILDPI